jgi:uncharacterized coiled-coil DUF342 family protein
VTIEQLKQDIAELEKQEADILGQDTIDQDKLNIVRNRLSELNYELEQLEQSQKAEQAHQERVVQATDELSDVIDHLDVGDGLTLRNYIDNESDYQVVTIAIKQAVSAKIAAFSETIKGYEEREADFRKQIGILQQQAQESHVDMLQLVDEKADLNNKLFNAGSELDKAKAEIESLKSQLTAMSKTATATTELSAEERAKRVLEKKAEITVYNVRPNREINPTEFTATLAATGQDITYNWVQKGRYIVVDETTASQFRTEYEAATKPVEENPVPDQPLDSSIPSIPDVAPVGEQFPQANPVGSDAVQTSEAVDQSAGENDAVSRAEFEALKADVAVLKSLVHGTVEAA